MVVNLHGARKFVDSLAVNSMTFETNFLVGIEFILDAAVVTALSVVNV